MYVYDGMDFTTVRRRTTRHQPDGPVKETGRSAMTMVQDKFHQLWTVLAYWYLLWELYTVTYMMEPMEKVVVNLVLISILGVLMWAALTYLPGHAIMVFQFLTGMRGT